ncbi:hypothetical protein [Streptomyces sp. NPDC058614]|uniref:hypothetical protein n=1 Tax=Streptomyces sp. NPDC058614 TaxID=3346557 RepID=UPI00366A523D
MSERMKQFQARFEPLITQILLMTIFVVGVTAQFVKPVGDALQDKAFLGGALLSLVGYVLYDTVKDVAASLRLPPLVQVESRELGGFVSEAFRAREVEIRFLGYTGETLYNELYHRLEGLLEDPGPTRFVSVRVLIPDFGQPMTVPSRVGSDGVTPVDDPDYRKRLELKCQEYDQYLSAIAERLSSVGRVTAECEYRLYPGIPRDKICIFNRELVLHGLYDVVNRTVLRSSDPEYYDPKGYRTDLNVWSREGGEDSKAVVATWNKHLDDLWSLAALPGWRRVTPP